MESISYISTVTMRDMKNRQNLQNQREMSKICETFKDVVEVNGNWYTLYLTINKETGEVIDTETWVEL